MKSGRNNSKIFTAIFIFLGAAGLILSSCQSNRWFQSESSLNAKIQTTWNKIKIDPHAATEQWKFSEGKVYRLKDTTEDIGNYSVSTTLSKAYLTITDFSVFPMDAMNAKWEILELEGGVLAIATDHDGSSGVKELEFSEK